MSTSRVEEIPGHSNDEGHGEVFIPRALTIPYFTANLLTGTPLTSAHFT